METGWRLATAPDGNGGLFPALRVSGILEDMRRRGVTGVHVSAVDNACKSL
jgi:UDP-N-acetylglucosamine/UDP-N-acetylgalactosamine diphosphorylase